MSAPKNVAALLKKHAALEKHSGGTCSVKRSGQAELIDALIDTGKSAAFLSAVLKAEHIPVTAESLRRHIRRDCACER